MTQPGFSLQDGSHLSPPASAPPHYGSVPPLGASIPPNPHQRKRSALRWVLGGIGAVVVLGGAAGGFAYHRWRAAKAVALPVDASLLPSDTTEVATQLIEATREPDERIRRSYLAAELGAELCRPGSRDPARFVEGIGSGSARAAKEFFRSASALDDARSLLDCGSILGESLESPYQAVVGVESGDESRQMLRVGVGHFRAQTLPESEGFVRHSFGGVSGFCRTKSDDIRPFDAAVSARQKSAGAAATECTESSLGAFVRGTTWFIGRRAALETMAPSVLRPKEQLTVRLEALKAAAGEMQGLPVVQLRAQAKSSKEFFIAPCLFGAAHSGGTFTAFIEGCFPARSNERLLEQIDAKLKAAAYETDGDPAKAGSYEGNIVFVARDDKAAKGVERDVQDVVTSWRAHLRENQPKLVIDANEHANTAREKKFAAIVDSYFKALKGAKVSRSGRTVRVRFSEKLSKAEIAAVEEAERSTVEKRRATADVLEAVRAKRAMPQASLAVLVGPTWATYLAKPPASESKNVRRPMSTEECKRLQARIAPLDATKLTTLEARIMFVSHRVAACTTRPPEVDDRQRACLAAFKTATDYAKCAPSDAGASADGEPPESEFGDRGRRR